MSLWLSRAGAMGEYEKLKMEIFDVLLKVQTFLKLWENAYIQIRSYI